MKCIILCGGMGTRLREETEYRPKPMIHIGDRPLLWHIMKIYAYHGYDEFVLPLGYKGEQIKDYFINYEVMNNDFTIELGKPDSVELHNSHPDKGWRITLVDTGEKTLKGGRLKRVQQYLGDEETFMVTYGDGVADVDISALLAFHRSHGKAATVTGVRPLSRFGELSVEQGRVTSFLEKPQSSGGNQLINGGFFVLERSVLERLTVDADCDLEYGALEDLASEGELMVYRHDGFWFCMDTIRDYEALNKMWSEGNAPWKIW